MRILEHRIFSKSFGGKIFRIWTDVTYRTNFFKKKAHAYCEHRIFFLVFWRENSKLLNSPWLKFFLQSDTKANQLSAILVKPVAVLSWVRCAKSVWYH